MWSTTTNLNKTLFPPRKPFRTHDQQNEASNKPRGRSKNMVQKHSNHSVPTTKPSQLHGAKTPHDTNSGFVGVLMIKAMGISAILAILFATNLEPNSPIRIRSAELMKTIVSNIRTRFSLRCYSDGLCISILSTKKSKKHPVGPSINLAASLTIVKANLQRNQTKTARGTQKHPKTQGSRSKSIPTLQTTCFFDFTLSKPSQTARGL